MSTNFDGPTGVLPTVERWLESVKNVEELQGISQFPNRLLRYARKSAANGSAISNRLKLAKTEQDIQPNGGTGQVRCYSARSAVGTPYAADSGQLIAELLWMDNDEQISEGIEVLLAFFADLQQDQGTVGGDFDSANLDKVAVYSDTGATTRRSWADLDGVSFIEFQARFTDFTSVRPILTAFDNGTLSITGVPNASAMWMTTSGALRWSIGGSTAGVQRVTGSINYGLADGEFHTYRIEHDGAWSFDLYRDNVLFESTSITGANASFIDSPLDLGYWDSHVTTDQYMLGAVRNFKVRVDGAWLFSFNFDELSGTAVVDSVGVGSGVLSSGDTASFWSLNSAAGKSGWLIIGADCETQANTTGDAP